MKKTIFQALRSSSKILMASFGKGLKVSRKKDQSNIVTKADLRSNQKIIDLIKSKFPNHNIISEEMGFSFQKSVYSWIIDPLDGTSNYASRLSWFGVLIAILKDWRPIIAGISLPFYKKIYFAQKSKGAVCNNKKIKATKENNLSNVLVSYSLDFSSQTGKTEKEVEIIKLLVKKIRNLRATNSCFDACAVAEGKYGAYLNQTSKIWDVAAPYLVVKEAGGEFTDILGKGIVFNSNQKNYSRNFTSLTASKNLHPQILSITQKVIKKPVILK